MSVNAPAISVQYPLMTPSTIMGTVPLYDMNQSVNQGSVFNTNPLNSFHWDANSFASNPGVNSTPASVGQQLSVSCYSGSYDNNSNSNNSGMWTLNGHHNSQGSVTPSLSQCVNLFNTPTPSAMSIAEPHVARSLPIVNSIQPRARQLPPSSHSDSLIPDMLQPLTENDSVCCFVYHLHSVLNGQPLAENVYSL